MIETNKAFITPDCFFMKQIQSIVFHISSKIKHKTLGNLVRGSGVGYLLDMAQGAPISF